MSLTGKLQDLVELLTDSQKGYGESAAHVQNEALKEKFMRIGNGRAPWIESIGNELAKLGEETSMNGTTKGALHRAWIDLREKFASRDDLAIVSECQRGDEHLIEHYDSVINDDEVPYPFKEILQEHRVMIQSDLGELQLLEQTIKKHEQQH
jgi:uncharacterized protein (TIGR02284 family)